MSVNIQIKELQVIKEAKLIALLYLESPAYVYFAKSSNKISEDPVTISFFYEKQCVNF